MSSLKQRIWHSVAKGYLGLLLKPFGGMLRDRETLCGLRNPMHMKFLATEQAGNLYVSEIENHMSLGSASSWSNSMPTSSKMTSRF
jgi:hypothetical protein